MPPSVSPLNSPPAGGAYYQLNRRQQVFVDQLALNGGDILEAYRHAGYIAEDGNERSSAWHLAGRSDVRKALLEVVRGHVAIASPGLIEMLKKIAGDGKTATRDRIQAVRILLDVGGVQAPEEQNVNVEVRLNRREYEQLAVTLLGRMTPDDLKVIDAEFKEVPSGHSKPDSRDGGPSQEVGLHSVGGSGPVAEGERDGGSCPEAGTTDNGQADSDFGAGDGIAAQERRPLNLIWPPGETEPRR